ncbi:phage integrase [Candidatus Halobonum tyrrellensis]|uniref:Putative phage integrase n=1 Tax=Candidatus Halobonum tyrrellensis G22 TaxID=1324957 RepID=V4HGE5_9EURY|nr:phage integrase [Candidatus Halobonum tyrrellensis]ESP86864.1 putative phage integrase [Candidatus Halobonum tyrrellensis G22]
MYRTPHDEHDGMKVWLAADEADDYLALVEDTTHRIALSLGLRCGLRSAEIVQTTPGDLADGPAGTMLRVPDGKGGKYRETPVPPELKTTIQTVDNVRAEPSSSPLVDASTRTLRRWVRKSPLKRPKSRATTAGGTSRRTTSGGHGRRCSPEPRRLTRCSSVSGAGGRTGNALRALPWRLLSGGGTMRGA